MQRRGRHPDATRASAEALLRDGAVTVAEIAALLGVPRRTVVEWDRRAGGLKTVCRRAPAPMRWSGARREAMGRILRGPGVDPGDLAVAAGFARESAPALTAALGGQAPPGASAGAVPGEPIPGPRALRARLRAHIARQIAVFDAALADPGKSGSDSARVLRDLGGLKRLLDDLGQDAGRDPGHHDDAAEGEPRDELGGPVSGDAATGLGRVRAEIARRYERFVGLGTAA